MMVPPTLSGRKELRPPSMTTEIRSFDSLKSPTRAAAAGPPMAWSSDSVLMASVLGPSSAHAARRSAASPSPRISEASLHGGDHGVVVAGGAVALAPGQVVELEAGVVLDEAGVHAAADDHDVPGVVDRAVVVEEIDPQGRLHERGAEREDIGELAVHAAAGHRVGDGR